MSPHSEPASTESEISVHCSQCDAQLAIFVNRWVKLTNSYGRAQEKGMHHNTLYASHANIIPTGPKNAAAQGCLMQEIYCGACKNVIGQYCKDIATREQERLKDNHYYKLSKVYLKDVTTNARIDPTFVADEEQLVARPISRSSAGPSTFSKRLEHISQKTPMRQSFPGATAKHQGGDAHHPLARPLSQRATPEYSGLVRPDSAQPPTADHATGVAEFAANTEARLSLHILRTSRYESQLGQHEHEMETQRERISDLERRDNLLSDFAKEADEAIVDHDGKIAAQAAEIGDLKRQLENLQDNMDELRRLITDNRGRVTPTENGFDKHINELRRNNREMEALRDENRMLKARLQSAANVIINSPRKGESSTTEDGTTHGSASRKRPAEDAAESDRASKLRPSSVNQIFGLVTPTDENVPHHLKSNIARARHSDMFESWQRARDQQALKETTNTRVEPTPADIAVQESLSRIAAARPTLPAEPERSRVATPLDAFKGSVGSRPQGADSPFRSNKPRSMLSRPSVAPATVKATPRTPTVDHRWQFNLPPAKPGSDAAQQTPASPKDRAPQTRRLIEEALSRSTHSDTASEPQEDSTLDPETEGPNADIEVDDDEDAAAASAAQALTQAANSSLAVGLLNNFSPSKSKPKANAAPSRIVKPPSFNKGGQGVTATTVAKRGTKPATRAAKPRGRGGARASGRAGPASAYRAADEAESDEESRESSGEEIGERERIAMEMMQDEIAA